MPHGVIHWEIGGRDLETLTTFYHELFGWNPESFDEDYRLVTPEDGIGGGLMRCRENIPPYVTVYVSVDDLGVTLERVGDLGGTTLVPPTPIPGIGAFAMFQDPEQNVIGILQAKPGTANR